MHAVRLSGRLAADQRADADRPGRQAHPRTPVKLVTLAPGATGSALLHIVDALNFTPSDCSPTKAAYLRIYPPNQSSSVLLANASEGCAKAVQVLTIDPVQAGARAPPRNGGSVAGMTNLGAAGLPGAVASGYHGPPALTVPRAFTEWTVDPWMLALILVLGLAYLTGIRKVRRIEGSWPAARSVWFCGLGLGFLIIATQSWVGVYQPVLFYVRAVQTVLLVLLVPLFLALGRPISLFIAAFPRAGARLAAAIGSRLARILTFPAITTFALIAVPFAMYFTTWYTWVFRSTTVRELTFVALMIPGYVFFWTLLRVDPVPRKYPYAVSMWITGAEVIGDAFFGIAVIADQNLLGYAYYHALARPWGPSLADRPGPRRRCAVDPRRPGRAALPGRAADSHDARGRVRRRPH